MSSEPQAQSALTSSPAARHRGLTGQIGRRSALIGIALAILFGWQWYDTRSRIDALQGELARRLGEDDTIAKETRALARQSQDAIQSLTAKVGAVEAKQAEMVGQQMALDAIYQDLSRSRDERLQAEIEQAVTLAAQQLAVAGNVQAALIALQGADARLARAVQPQWLPVRKLINRDIDRLRALPLADVPGISLKLDGIGAVIDTLPLAHEQRPPVEAPPAHSPTELGWWRGLVDDFWNDTKQLIRIERMDRPAPALLSPQQAFFLRENLKLRLVNARLSLLQRDGRGFREDISQARNWLDTYFDGRARSVRDAAATLKGLAAIEVSQELPSLDELLAALRSMKLARAVGTGK